MYDTEAYIEENIPLVKACIMRFCGKGIEYDDLFQAGCEGLVKAAKRFDRERGCCFSTYAVPVIMGEVRRLFRDGGSIHVSRSLKERSQRLARIREQLCSGTGREVSVSELASAADMTPEEVSEALNASEAIVSLNVADEDGSHETDIPVQAPECRITELLSLRQELARLDECDRKLLYLRYFCGLTQGKAAEKLSMTQVQVSRREKKLIAILRRRLAV